MPRWTTTLMLFGSVPVVENGRVVLGDDGKIRWKDSSITVTSVRMRDKHFREIVLRILFRQDADVLRDIDRYLHEAIQTSGKSRKRRRRRWVAAQLFRKELMRMVSQIVESALSNGKLREAFAQMAERRGPTRKRKAQRIRSRRKHG